MKKTIAFTLIALTLLCIVGCSQKQSKLQAPADFYYCDAKFNNDYTEFSFDGKTPIVQSEQRETVHHADDMTALVNEYLKGPQSADLVSPFPKDVTVISYRTNDDVVILELSANLAELTGVDLTVATACLAKTVLEHTDSRRVHILCENGNLLDGAKVTILDKDYLQFLDQSTTPTEGE